MKIIGYRKLWFSLSALVVVASIVLLGVFGLRLGIDFTGGSLLEAKYTEIELPVLDDIRFKIEEEGFLFVVFYPSNRLFCEQGACVFIIIDLMGFHCPGKSVGGLSACFLRKGGCR